MAVCNIVNGILHVHNMFKDSPEFVLYLDTGLFTSDEAVAVEKVVSAWNSCALSFNITDDATRAKALDEVLLRDTVLIKEPKQIDKELALPMSVIKTLHKNLVDAAKRENKYVQTTTAKIPDTVNKDNPIEASCLLNYIMEAQIRATALNECADAVIKIINGETDSVVFNTSRVALTHVLNAIDLILKDKNKTTKIPPEVRYQYTGLQLAKYPKDETSHITKIRSSLAMILGNRVVIPTNTMRISVYTEQKDIVNRELSLRQLYPTLKADLKNIRKNNVGNTWRGKDMSFDYDTMNYYWREFQNTKCKLMFIGYPENKVTLFLSKCLFNISTTTVCDITKQCIPSIFAVPVRKLTGETVSVNIFWITECNNNIRRSCSLLKYSLDVTKSFWLERSLEDKYHYYADKHRHDYNVLSLLSPRAMKGENTHVYTSNKGYRPTPYLGVELEVERSETCVENITKLVYDSIGHDFAIIKHDGSLNGHNPFEITTIPATLEYHKMRWNNFMDAAKLKQNLVSYKPGTCGIHVHISRDSFTGLHLAKFMRFINMAENYKFITKIAQRSNNTYTRYSVDSSLMTSAKAIRCGLAYGHYDAVNTTNNNTIEVRIFRGNLSKIAFYKNIEFVHAVWAYTQTCSMKELNYKDFMCWLFDNKKDHHGLYNNLEKWLIAAGYNISNIQISRTSTDEEKIKLLEERKRRKKMQLVISRRFKTTPTKIGKEDICDVLASA